MSDSPFPLPAPAQETTPQRCPRCGKLNVDVHTCSASPWAAEYERIRPALDALAAAVKGCGEEVADDEGTGTCGEQCALCYECNDKLWNCITSLTRTLP